MWFNCLIKIRGPWGPEGTASEFTAELEPEASAPLPGTGSLLALPQRGPFGVGGSAFVLPLLCQLGCGNTMNRGCDMQPIKLLVDWETAVKSYFQGLGISSMLLSVERDRDKRRT